MPKKDTTNTAKTNAMRELDQIKASYKPYFFERPEGLSGLELAQFLGLDADRVFKTLVTQGKSAEHYVFMIPVALELDLKKAAAVCGEKSIHMVKSKDLLPLTGYIHGGCSPLSMKKLFFTAIDETAELFETIIFSGGRTNCQIETSLDALASVIPLQIADLT